MAAASFALAILAHPGCVFSAPALILLWLPVRKLITVRQYVYAAVLIVSFQLSWAAYQHIYDPPGNRLLKMHLGGVMEPDNRSTWQAIKSGYTQPAAGTLVHNKLLNFENILGPNLLHKGIGWESLRIAERDSISYAIGVLNLGWVAAIIYFMKGKRRERLGWGMLILLSLVDMAIWATVIYGPGYTDTTESSYFDLLLLSIGLCGFLISVRRLAMLAFVLQVVNVLAVWVWFVPSETAAGGAMLQWPFLLIGICCTSALVWHFGHVYKAEPSEIVGKG